MLLLPFSRAENVLERQTHHTPSTCPPVCDLEEDETGKGGSGRRYPGIFRPRRGVLDPAKRGCLDYP